MKHKIPKAAVLSVSFFLAVTANAGKESNPSVRNQIKELQDQIDQLASEPKAVLIKDGNGIYIGRVIGMERVSVPYVLTDQGFRTILSSGGELSWNFQPSDLRPMAFETTNCTEVGYHIQPLYIGTVFRTIIDPA